MKFKELVKIAILVLMSRSLSSQSFLNGSFEVNSASTCDFNMANAAFTTKMPNCNAFGGGGELDIFQSSCGYGTAQHGNWMVGVATPSGNTDAFTMTLNAPLVTGTTYTIQFFDKSDPTYSPGVPIRIGLSTVPGALGTILYTGPVPTAGVWSARVFSFVAPNNGQYISVSSPATTRWSHVDNFSFIGCSTPTIAVTPSSSVCAGSAVTLTVTGAASYTWSPAASLSSTTGSVVTATPGSTTTYTVMAGSGTCTTSAVTTVSITSAPAITINPATASICQGSAIALTASGSTSYTWSPAATLSNTNTANTNASPSVTTTYTVIGGTGTCTNSATRTVSVTPIPTLTLTPSFTTICAGSSATLSATGATTYTWNPAASLNNANLATVVASPATTTTYTITGANGICTNTAVATVSIVAVPTLTVVPGATGICVGTSATLTASGATSYTWSPSGSLSAANGSVVVASPTVITNYTVTGANSICTNTAITTVSVVSAPVLSLSPQTATICAGDVTSLSVTGSSNYTWLPATSLSSSTGSLVTASPTTTTIYTVTGGVGTCTAAAEATITVNPIPSLTLTPTSVSICAGTSATLSAAGATTYTWAPAATLSSSSGSSVTATPATTTIYTITGAINSCTATATTTVNVIANPTLNIVANTTVCAGTSATLTVNGASTYTWSPAATLSASSGSVVVASPATTQTYSITGTLNTCTATASTTVTIVPRPIIVMGANADICSGTSAPISASGATTYSWIPSTGLSATTGATVNASPNATTVYTVTGTTAGCSSSGVSTVSVTTTPTLTAIASPTSVCRGTSSNLSVFGALSYTWSPAGSLSTVNSSTTVANPALTTTYTIIGANGSCVASTTIELVVMQTATVQINPVPPVCLGSSTNIEATGGTSYSWLPVTGLVKPTAAGTMVWPLTTTVYTVTANGAGLCPGTGTVIIVVNPVPHVFAGRDTTVNIDEFVTLTGTGDVEVGFFAPTAVPLACNFCNAITVNPQEPTCYVLKGENGYGCVDFDTVCVTVTKDYNVYIPNAFTPNEDGNNDVFIPVGYGLSEIRLSIFDRWGTLIFASNDTNVGWDGSYKGKQCEQGVYVYMAEIKTMAGTTIERTGHVTLLPKSVAR